MPDTPNNTTPAAYILSRDGVISLLDHLTDDVKSTFRGMFPGSSSVFVGYEDPNRPGTQIGEIVSIEESTQ